MLYTCFRVTKAKIIVFCVVILLSLAVIVLLNKTGKYDMSSNSGRLKYISSLSVSVDKNSCVEKQIVIPRTFSDVYVKYNALQKEAGYNLEEYAGKTVVQYTYTVKNKQNCVVNLLVYNNKLIGGDICETNLGGKMYPLSVG